MKSETSQELPVIFQNSSQMFSNKIRGLVKDILEFKDGTRELRDWKSD